MVSAEMKGELVSTRLAHIGEYTLPINSCKTCSSKGDQVGDLVIVQTCRTSATWPRSDLSRF